MQHQRHYQRLQQTITTITKQHHKNRNNRTRRGVRQKPNYRKSVHQMQQQTTRRNQQSHILQRQNRGLQKPLLLLPPVFGKKFQTLWLRTRKKRKITMIRSKHHSLHHDT
eukprot:PhF_6_TR30537/c0_g1_i3/m.44810